MRVDMYPDPFSCGCKRAECKSRDEALVRAGIGIAHGLRFSVLGDGTEVLCKPDRASPQELMLGVVQPKKIGVCDTCDGTGMCSEVGGDESPCLNCNGSGKIWVDKGTEEKEAHDTDKATGS